MGGGGGGGGVNEGRVISGAEHLRLAKYHGKVQSRKMSIMVNAVRHESIRNRLPSQEDKLSETNLMLFRLVLDTSTKITIMLGYKLII